MAELKIEIDDDEFLGKTQKEQNLIMFKKLCSIDAQGCSYSRNKEKKQNKKNSAISAITGVFGGFIAVLVKIGLLGE